MLNLSFQLELIIGGSEVEGAVHMKGGGRRTKWTFSCTCVAISCFERSFH